MLYTLTIKDQPLWNIQSFTADVAACFGVHADRYMEEPKTFSDISLKPSETTVNASINWMPDINQGLRQASCNLNSQVIKFTRTAASSRRNLTPLIAALF